MTFLSLKDTRSDQVRDFTASEVRLGRDPACEWVLAGEGAEVVSGQHARLTHRDGHWWVEDVGSRNGTTLDGRPISHGHQEQVAVGSVIGLGDRGPRLRVEAVEKRVTPKTVIEMQRAARPSAPTMPMPAVEEATLPMAAVGRSAAEAPAKPAPGIGVTVRDLRNDRRLEAKGSRIRLGRGDECELRPLQEGDTSVSRVHAEILWLPEGRAVVRDAKSRNGTYVNGHRITGDHDLKVEDRITLGDGGPDLLVEALTLPSGEKQDIRKKPAPPPPGAAKPAESRKPPAAARRSFAGKGKTVFFREMMEESSKKSASRLRGAIWTFVVILAAAVGGIYWYTDQQQRKTAAELDQQRQALAAASERTGALESALKRAEGALAQQVASGDSAQRASLGELARLRSALNEASARPVSSGDDPAARAMMDSLRLAIRDQERRNAAIQAQVRAMKGVNLPAIAQASGPAVGLVTGFGPSGAWDGSGFVITRSGYFVTNRHVATDEGRPVDSIFVMLNGTRQQLRADVVNVGRGELDLAVMRIRNYSGPVVPQIDWTSTRARQGEPAALIGFPAGVGLAYDPATGAVFTSMAAGIFAQVTSEGIRFDGFSVGGSSGSPLFNADGEVVAVHRAGLRESVAEGQKRYGFAVPVKLLVPLLPPEAKAELGLR